MRFFLFCSPLIFCFALYNSFIFTEDRTKNGTLWVLPWSIAFFWVNNLSMLTIRAREVKTMGGKRF